MRFKNITHRRRGTHPGQRACYARPPVVAVKRDSKNSNVVSGVRALFATLPSDLTAFVRIVPLEPDIRVVAFSFVAAVGSAFIFGLVPSLQTTRVSVVEATRGIFANEATPSRLRNVLVVGQIVVASLFLMTAGVMLRETSRLGRTATGLRTRNVLSVEIQDRSRAAVLASLNPNRFVETIASAARALSER